MECGEGRKLDHTTGTKVRKHESLREICVEGTRHAHFRVAQNARVDTGRDSTWRKETAGELDAKCGHDLLFLHRDSEEAGPRRVVADIDNDVNRRNGIVPLSGRIVLIGKPPPKQRFGVRFAAGSILEIFAVLAETVLIDAAAPAGFNDILNQALERSVVAGCMRRRMSRTEAPCWEALKSTLRSLER